MESDPFSPEDDFESVKSLPLPEGLTCLVCFEDLSNQNMVAYKANKDSSWHLSTFCVDCIKYLLKIQFHKYLNTLSTTNCAKEQRTLLDRGPPINVSDRLGFPEAGNDEVYSLFDFGTLMPLSPKLDGSKVFLVNFTLSDRAGEDGTVGGA
ncbi:uncharacterized protein TA04140 [Theileria annulata]|uniref:Uncharacterized protein n=1 Tax=Theileria annulata TaxID=5874 RepID=Q4UC76_THEAN|nr:uncharacterized protein TA04140 [Theileria annulata]CAI75575.1 hypothetical protein, conserved [Theileria annulata]|eukprot:XP_955051.1 hypothetical protein, conserved [Theileria annulata]